MNKDERFYKPPGGESRLDVFQRAKKILYDLIREYVKNDYEEEKEKCTTSNIEIESKCIMSKFSDENDLEIDFRETEKIINGDNKDNINLENIPINGMNNINLINPIDNFSGSSHENIFSFPLDDNDKETISFLNNSVIQNEVEIYDREEINSLIEKLDLAYLNAYPFKEYNPLEKIKRILIVSHSGCISEILNVIKDLKNLKSNEIQHSKNTAVYAIRIYCNNCGKTTKCKNEAGCGLDFKNIEFEFLLANDVSHLNALK